MFLRSEPLKNRWFLRLLILKRKVWCPRSGMAEASGQGGRRPDQILAEKKALLSSMWRAGSTPHCQHPAILLFSDVAPFLKMGEKKKKKF